MIWPTRVQEIVNEIVDRNQDLAHGNDDDRRILTMKMAQQCCFELGPTWGTKRGDPTRPLSKDAIALNGIPLLSWDTLNGVTREPNQYPESDDITGQIFVEVTPINHLDVIPPDDDDDDIQEKLDFIISQNEKILALFNSFSIVTAHGYLCLTPEGTLEYRVEAKEWETFGLRRK